MPKRSSKPKKVPRDVNELARFIIGAATADEPEVPENRAQVADKPSRKNPAAVALGKLGGAKGGKARAASLSKKQRSEIARIAASARWKKSD